MPKDTDSQFFCGHCKQFLGKSTFYKHKKRFYNISTRKWQVFQVDTQTTGNKPRRSPRSFIFQEDIDTPFDDDFLESASPSDHRKSALLTVY